MDPHFLDLGIVGGEWSASRPCCFTPGKRAPGTHWIGGWVGPRAGLDDVEKRKFSNAVSYSITKGFANVSSYL
jgi:hypothetical protein